MKLPVSAWLCNVHAAVGYIVGNGIEVHVVPMVRLKNINSLSKTNLLRCRQIFLPSLKI